MNAPRISRRTLCKSAAAVVGGVAQSACMPAGAPSPAVLQLMKQTGMCWSRPNAEAMPALSTRLLNDRWLKFPYYCFRPKSSTCLPKKVVLTKRDKSQYNIIKVKSK